MVETAAYSQKFELQRGLTTNSTDTAYTAIAPTSTEPVSVDSTSPAQNAIVMSCSGTKAHLFFFGDGNDNSAFQSRVLLWSKVRRTSAATVDLWVPYLVGEFEAVLSTAVGVASAAVIATDRFADAVTEVGTTWDDNIVEVKTTTADTLARVSVTTIGFQKIGIYFDMDAPAGTDATGCNCCVGFTN